MKFTKNILCSNTNCKRVLAQTDGEKITPANTSVFSNKLSDKKKKYNPLYCRHCHHITRFYKKKFQSKIKKSENFIKRVNLKKGDNSSPSK